MTPEAAPQEDALYNHKNQTQDGEIQTSKEPGSRTPLLNHYTLTKLVSFSLLIGL